MKNKFKTFIFLLVIFPLNILAKENYKIENVYINAELNEEGNLLVQEAIVAKGNIEKFSNECNYLNESYANESSEKGNIDFKGSSFYNGKSISFIKLASFNLGNDKIDWTIISTAQKNLAKEKNENNKNKQNIYETKKTNYGEIATLYYKGDKGYTVYYFEYEIERIAVLHNDTGEIYWQVLNSKFDNASNVKVQLLLPGKTKKSKFKYWAHGSLKGEIAPITSNLVNAEEDFYKGVLLSVEDYKKNNSLDIRVLFDKQILTKNIESLNNSEESAYDKIIKIEKDRASNSDNKRDTLTTLKNANIIISSIYILGVIVLWIIVSLKNKKIHYYKYSINEPIANYSVGVIDYLLNKEVSKNSFISEIIKLIYNKSINVNVENDNIILVKRNPANELISDKILIDIIFSKNSEKVKLNEVISNMNNYPNIYNETFYNWKEQILKEFNQNNFITKNKEIKIIGIVYFILGLILIAYNFIFKINNFLIVAAIVIMSTAFLIYILNLDDKTKKGKEHYLKWLDFKSYLKSLVLEENREKIKESNLPYYILFKINLTTNFSDKRDNEEFIKIKKIYEELTKAISKL